MSNIFEKKTGNYVRPGDPIGQHEDSLVANIQRLDPATRQRIYVGGDSTPDPSDTVAPMTDAVSTSIVQDLDRIVRGRGERIETMFVREELVRHGVDPDRMPSWPEKKRRHFHNECVRLLRRKILDRNVDQDLTRTYDMLLVAPDTDPVIWSNFTNANETMRTTAGEVRRALGMSVEDFFALGREGRVRVIKKVSHKLRVGGASVKGRDTLRFTQERTSLHHALSSWASGELRLERPQSSSLHLMVEYDRPTRWESSLARSTTLRSWWWNTTGEPAFRRSTASGDCRTRSCAGSFASRACACWRSPTRRRRRCLSSTVSTDATITGSSMTSITR